METGARVASGGAIGLWTADAVLLSSDRAVVGTTRWLTGLGAALLVAVTTALVVGAVLGPLVVPVASDAAARLRAFRDRLRDTELATQHDLAARLLALTALTALAALAANRVAFLVVMGLARPESMAMVLAATHVGLAATLVLLWPPAVRLAGAAVGGLARVRGLRWLVDRAARTAGILAVGAVAVGCVMASTRWNVLRALPWRTVLPLPGFALGMVLAARVDIRSAVTARRRHWAVVTVCLALGAWAGARLRPEASAARRIAFDRALSGAVGYAAWTVALDVDRDGQLGVLGGGDCAPLDRRRYTGAVDVPGDGIDQDCDGVDATLEPVRHRRRVMLPAGMVPSQPTVVLITVDGLAARRLGALGGDPTVMPRVNQLAAGGAFFTACFSEGPSTRLSFPSMFTSRWDSELTFSFASRPPYPLAPGERQLQDLLDDGGYETIAVVPHPYFTPEGWPSVTRGFQRVDTSAVAAGKNNAREVTDAALRAIGAPGDRPRYLWVHYYDAHAPYVPPQGFPSANTSDAAQYDAELRFVDHEVGRLLDGIFARPEPTYVVLTADHGTVFSPRPWTRHGRYGFDLYTATLHVPLIVHGPGITPRRVEGLASTMDIVPTLADLLRLGDHSDFHGVSLVPELLYGADDRTRVLFHEYYLGERDYRGEDPLVMVSLRTGRWNLILDRTRGVYEFYDWTRDYDEANDRFEDAASLPKVMRLRGLLSSFVQQYHRRPPGAALLPLPPPDGH